MFRVCPLNTLMPTISTSSLFLEGTSLFVYRTMDLEEAHKGELFHVGMEEGYRTEGR